MGIVDTQKERQPTIIDLKIRGLMSQKKIKTKQELADKAEICYKTLYNVMIGRETYTGTLRKIEKALDVPVGTLSQNW